MPRVSHKITGIWPLQHSSSFVYDVIRRSGHMHDDHSHRIGGPTNGCHSDINLGFCVYPLPSRHSIPPATHLHRWHTTVIPIRLSRSVCTESGTFLAGPDDLGEGAAERMRVESDVCRQPENYTPCHSQGNLHGHRCPDRRMDRWAAHFNHDVSTERFTPHQNDKIGFLYYINMNWSEKKNVVMYFKALSQ